MPDMSLIKTALPGYVTTAEAAEALGYATTATLAKLCVESRILAIKWAKRGLYRPHKCKLLPIRRLTVGVEGDN